MTLRASIKISIFLVPLVGDLLFFTVVRQYFPESYEWMISTISYYTQVPLEVTQSLFIITGFVIALICAPLILSFIYNSVKKTVK
jgi:hypothetical protein